MGREPIELGPYTGGVNLVDPTSKLLPNELRRCSNYRTGDRGNFYKRPGHGNYGTAPAKINGDALVNLLLRFYKADGTKKTIAAAGGKLRFGTDASGAWTDISIDGSGASMSSTELCDWMAYKDYVYIADGVRPQRYNLVDNIYAGHVVPAAPTLSSQATGGSLTLLNTYKYFYTSVEGDRGEGPKGAELSVTLTGSNNRINLATIADAASKYGQTAKRLYRTKGNGSIFYFLTEIAPLTTTYQDNIADTALDEEYIPVIAPPSDARFVIMGHDERAYWFGMAGANASIVRVSDVGFPDRIVNNGTEGFFSVQNNDGDILTGGARTPGGILFFKRNSVWLLRAYGFGLTNISPKDQRSANVGCTAPYSIVATPVGLIFLSQRGEVYLFDGSGIKEIGRKIASEFISMTESAMSKVVACYHDRRYQISYDFRGSKGYNWRTLEYDPFTDKWEGPHENGTLYCPSYYSVWDSSKDKGELYFGESRAANGSYIYGRSEFSKTDRGTKFISIARPGSLALSGLGDVVSVKVLIHGEFSSDANLSIKHIDERNQETQGNFNSPVLTTPAKWTSGNKWEPHATSNKWGGKLNGVLEASLGPGARSKTPTFEISDGGTALDVNMNIIELLAERLPPT